MDAKARGASVMRKTILVADDTAQLRKAACAMLMQSENLADCIEAENGLLALQIAIARKPDLVILDYSMPVMGGFEAAKRIHEVLPGTPIVLFSLFAMFLQDHSVAK
jgi:CheY-like chemotaxis protein